MTGESTDPLLVVIDDSEFGGFSMDGPFAFSNNGKHFLFYAAHQSKAGTVNWQIYVDGSPVDAHISPLAFSYSFDSDGSLEYLGNDHDSLYRAKYNLQP